MKRLLMFILLSCVGVASAQDQAEKKTTVIELVDGKWHLNGKEVGDEDVAAIEASDVLEMRAEGKTKMKDFVIPLHVYQGEYRFVMLDEGKVKKQVSIQKLTLTGRRYVARKSEVLAQGHASPKELDGFVLSATDKGRARFECTHLVYGRNLAVKRNEKFKQAMIAEHEKKIKQMGKNNFAYLYGVHPDVTLADFIEATERIQEAKIEHLQVMILELFYSIIPDELRDEKLMTPDEFAILKTNPTLKIKADGSISAEGKGVLGTIGEFTRPEEYKRRLVLVTEYLRLKKQTWKGEQPMKVIVHPEKGASIKVMKAVTNRVLNMQIEVILVGEEKK